MVNISVTKLVSFFITVLSDRLAKQLLLGDLQVLYDLGAWWLM